ncbi:MAG: HesA/MoeB/ThiF family protein [Armatimonadota bacterium]
MIDFTEEQIERYSRHILLSEVGVEGQRKLLSASALVVGAGGLGSPALFYLAAGGVGRIGIIDSDVVELSNLQRQILHGTSDVGSSKALSAQATVTELNPDCQIDVFDRRLDAGNARELMRGYDVVLDGSDNFPTRFLVADCCRFEDVPLVSAAVLRFEGQLMTVLPGAGNPCYRCFFPEPPPPGMVPSCQEAGVLGAVVGALGTLQAVEALKVLLGAGELLSHGMLLYDALDGTFTTVKRAPDPDCPLCGDGPTITDLVQYELSCDGDEWATGDGGEDTAPGA